MSLSEEIGSARTEIVTDSYEMSIGEVLNLYRDKEIVIAPDFQRLFRWDISRKTKFIESILLGIPIPPIFVFQREDGVWELIDGLQRLSTIFEFVGILRDGDDELSTPSIMEGTRFLPSLSGMKWESGEGQTNGLAQPQQLQIKRGRLRVEILKQESDSKAKYELFQRLNTGGAELSEQEVRNCIAVMLNKNFYDWLKDGSENQEFLDTIDQTEQALEKQMSMELLLRLVAYRSIPYRTGLDVHEYLDNALIEIASSDNFDFDNERDIIRRSFHLINNAMGAKAFKRWDGNEFRGKFLISVFEVVGTGVSKNIDTIEQLEDPVDFVQQRSKDLWSHEIFQSNSGAGIRGTTRLSNLLPMAENYFSVE